MDDKLSDLIELIYAAALDGELWPDVLTKLADEVGADRPGMGSYDSITGRAEGFAPRNDPADIIEFQEYWAAYNPLFAGWADRPLGKVFQMQSIVPREVFTRTPFYNEWWVRQRSGTAGLVAGALIDGPGFLGVGVFREEPRQHEPFGSAEMARFGIAMRHIVRAVQVHRRTRLTDLREQTFVSTLDRLGQGAFVVDAGGGVQFANRPAQALIAEGDGLRLEAGRLTTAGGGDTLMRLIASCAGIAPPGGPGGALAVGRKGRLPLRITVTPLRTRAEPLWPGLRRPVALLLVGDPEAEEKRRTTSLQRRFGLTPAEAAFALEIVKGDGRDAAAGRRGISPSTAHMHLSNIFGKTGAHRQAELVRLIFECGEGVWDEEG